MFDSIKKTFRAFIRRLLPWGLAEFLVSERLKAIQDTWQWGHFSYAQEGEDLIISALVGKAMQGHYIDIGCHHPVRFSNTYSLYLKGWRGLNIDAKPGTAKLFEPYRPEDHTLEMGIAQEAGELDFFVFEEGALNTFSTDLAKERIASGWPLKAQVKIPVMPLSQILDQYWPQGQSIDLMSIDIEGLDEEVLRSNNWSKYKPKILITEIYTEHIEDILQHPLYLLLVAQGYVWRSKTALNLIFTLQNA